MTHRTRRLLTAGAIATALAILAGCAAPAQNPEAGPTEEPVTQASTVTVDDAWVKTADGGMTAASESSPTWVRAKSTSSG